MLYIYFLFPWILQVFMSHIYFPQGKSIIIWLIIIYTILRLLNENINMFETKETCGMLANNFLKQNVNCEHQREKVFVLQVALKRAWERYLVAKFKLLVTSGNDRQSVQSTTSMCTVLFSVQIAS